MDEYEWRRAKPQLWGLFAAAAAMDVRSNAATAAHKADELLAEFEQRFPVRIDPDE